MIWINGSRFWLLLGGVALAIIGIWAIVADTDGPVSEPPVDPVAVYRSAARDAYEYALQESCEPDPRWERRTVLAAERRVLDEYGAGLERAALRFNFAVARADVELAMQRGQLGCWADDDPTFAEAHVGMAKRGLLRAVENLYRLEHAVPEAAPIDTIPTAVAADFRSKTKTLIEPLHPRCRLVSFQKDDRVLAAARERVRVFRRSLNDTGYALHFDIAESDAVFARSRGVVECAVSRSVPWQGVSAEYANAAAQQIAALSAIARPAAA